MINPGFQTIVKWGCPRVPLTSGLELVVGKEELQDQIRSAGDQLRFDYRQKDLTTIPVLEGGPWIHGRVASHLPEASTHMTVSIVAKRYGNKAVGGKVEVYYDWLKNHQDEQAKIRGRHCLIFDDVLDKGDTAARVIEVVREFEPASVKTLFMVRKKVTRTIEVRADYVLFDVDNLWLIGAGLDDKGYGRDRPHIACRTPE
jgi:hypoxanthine phosphoribosyltransferase